jgi:hypothetical protein
MYSREMSATEQALSRHGAKRDDKAACLSGEQIHTVSVTAQPTWGMYWVRQEAAHDGTALRSCARAGLITVPMSANAQTWVILMLLSSVM